MQTVSVNGQEIPDAAIAAELQHHPAGDVADAWRQATTALVIRRLLLDECARQGVTEGDEEAAIRALLAREITIPEADAATCRRYWTANRAHFRTPDVYEAAHILFPAPLDDDAARATAKAAAEETLHELAGDARKFDALARTRSACPSAANGGRLGQLTRGDLVPEIETFVFALEERQISPVPVMTRYGAHVLRLDRRAAGQDCRSSPSATASSVSCPRNRGSARSASICAFWPDGPILKASRSAAPRRRWCNKPLNEAYLHRGTCPRGQPAATRERIMLGRWRPHCQAAVEPDARVKSASSEPTPRASACNGSKPASSERRHLRMLTGRPLALRLVFGPRTAPH